MSGSSQGSASFRVLESFRDSGSSRASSLFPDLESSQGLLLFPGLPWLQASALFQASANSLDLEDERQARATPQGLGSPQAEAERLV